MSYFVAMVVTTMSMVRTGLSLVVVAVLLLTSCQSTAVTRPATDAAGASAGEPASDSDQTAREATAVPSREPAATPAATPTTVPTTAPTVSPTTGPEPVPTPDVAFLQPSDEQGSWASNAAGLADTAQPSAALVAASFTNRGGEVAEVFEDSVSSITVLDDGTVIFTDGDRTVVQTASGDRVESDFEGRDFVEGADGQIFARKNGFVAIDENWREVRRPLGEPAVKDEQLVTSFIALDNGTFATAGWDGMVRIWDLDANEMVSEFSASDDWVTSMVALDGNRIATGSRDNMVEIWDASTGTSLFSSDAHGSRVEALVALQDGRLASGGREIIVWDNDFADFVTLEVNDHVVSGLDQLPDGRIVSAGLEGLLYAWELPSLGEQWNGNVAAFLGHLGFVSHVAAAQDGTVYSGGELGRVLRWDMTTLAGTAPESISAGHTDRIWDVAVGTDGTVVTASHDGTIRFWDLASEQPQPTRVVAGQDQFTGVVSAIDGTVIAVDRGGTIHTVTSDGTSELKTISQWEAAAIAPDGLVWMGSFLGGIGHFNPATGQGKAIRLTSDTILYDIDVDADGTVFAVDRDAVYRVSAGTETLEVLYNEQRPGDTLAALDNGRVAITATSITLRDLIILAADGSIERSFRTIHQSIDLPSSSDITAIVALQDGRIATGGRGGIVQFWDPQGPEDQTAITYRLDGAEIQAMVEVPDVGLVVTAGRGLVVWELPPR